MRKVFKIIILIILICVVPASYVSAAEMGSSDEYTYSYDKRAIVAPESFVLKDVLSGSEDKDISFCDVSDIRTYNNELFVLDKKNQRIYVFNDKCKLDRVICTDLGLSSPEGFYISKNGLIYIADTENKRIVKTNIYGKKIAEIKAPDSKKTFSSVEYKPSQVLVDNGERIYVIVNNETNGIYQLDIDGTFLGFFGSVPVVPSVKELFWRSISTKEQLSRMLLFVPTEYSSMDIDSKGFIYTTVATNTDSEIQQYIKSGGSESTLAPIRRLNPKNNDVLKRTGSMPPAGDLINSSSLKESISSRFIDISVSSDGKYCVLDTTRGRVFVYDKNGELLYVFGNKAETKDLFINPTALVWWNDNIAVADKENASIKIYSPTEYANLINKAVKAEDAGDYSKSIGYWKTVSNIYQGSDIALIAIGRQEMRDGNYLKAMKCFKKADCSDYYSSALKQYRKIIGKKILAVLIVLIILIPIACFILRKCLKNHKKDGNKKHNEIIEGIKYGFYIIRHPFDGFWDMQFESRGNIKSASIIFGAVVLLNLLSTFTTGYLFSGKHGTDFNVLLKGVLSIVVPMLLWCVANWSVTSLMEGSGTFKYIYMYSCYSLTPFIIFTPILIVMSNILCTEETALYNIIGILSYVCIGFLLFVGTLVVHQYTGTKAVCTIIITLVAMGIIVFLFLLCLTVIRQMTNFIGLLIEEINLRI